MKKRILIEKHGVRAEDQISEHFVLMADETYLQKGSKLAGRDFIGAKKDDNLQKGIVFMVVGVKTNTPHVIKASPEVSIHGNWLADEMDWCISLLECLLYRVVEKYSYQASWHHPLDFAKKMLS